MEYERALKWTRGGLPAQGLCGGLKTRHRKS